MTATINESATAGPAAGGVGRVSRVIGPVVDVEFSADTMPEVYNLLTLEVSLNGEQKNINLEVAQHIGDWMVRAISLQPTDGIVRGSEAVSYTHLTLPTTLHECRSRWAPYH